MGRKSVEPKAHPEKRKAASLSWFVENGFIVPCPIKKKGSNFDLSDLHTQEEANNEEDVPYSRLYGANRAHQFEQGDHDEDSELLWDFFVIGSCEGSLYVIRLRDDAVFDSPSTAANKGYGEDYGGPINEKKNRVSGYDFLHLADNRSLTQIFCAEKEFPYKPKNAGIYKKQKSTKKIIPEQEKTLRKDTDEFIRLHDFLEKTVNIDNAKVAHYAQLLLKKEITLEKLQLSNVKELQETGIDNGDLCRIVLALVTNKDSMAIPKRTRTQVEEKEKSNKKLKTQVFVPQANPLSKNKFGPQSLGSPTYTEAAKTLASIKFNLVPNPLCQ